MLAMLASQTSAFILMILHSLRPLTFSLLLWSVSGLAQAATVDYTAILSGANEAPPNASPGTGLGNVYYDPVAHTLVINVSFSGLSGITTAAHIHAPTSVAGVGNAGVATTTPTFFGFPQGVTSGTYNATLDLTLTTSWNPSYLTANGGTTAGAEGAFAMALSDGKAYFNIHTDAFPGGEIRGFLTPAAASVPDTAGTLGLTVLALSGLASYSAWSRRRSAA